MNGHINRLFAGIPTRQPVVAASTAAAISTAFCKECDEGITGQAIGSRCPTCGATLIATPPPPSPASSSTTEAGEGMTGDPFFGLGADATEDQIFDRLNRLFGGDFTQQMREAVERQRPGGGANRKLTESYLKSVGILSLQDIPSHRPRQSLCLRDCSIQAGPMRPLAVLAAFSCLPEMNTEITAPLVLCEPEYGEKVDNAEQCRGAIVLVKRGKVTFASKVNALTAAGAKAVVICQVSGKWPFLATDSKGEIKGSLELGIAMEQQPVVSEEDGAGDGETTTMSFVEERGVSLIPVVTVSEEDGELLSRYCTLSNSHNKSAATPSAMKDSTTIANTVVTLKIGEDTKECPICQEGFTVPDAAADGSSSNNSSILKLPCRHVYHSECLSSWLHHNHTCPMCRLKLKSQSTHLLPASGSTAATAAGNTGGSNAALLQGDHGGFTFFS